MRRNEAAIWASVAFAAMAYQAALTWAGVAPAVQPPFWSAGGALAGALGLLLGRHPHPISSLWTRPLRLSGAVVSALSLAFAIEYLGEGQATLHTLAITMIVGAITLLAQGIVRRDLYLTYLGVALLDGGVLCELAFHHITQLQAYTAPIGVTLLVLAAIEWRRSPGSSAKVALEVGALVLLSGTALWQALGGMAAPGDHYAYATLVLFEGVALFGLGALVHWKRTFFAAGSTIVVDVFILLAHPMHTLSTWYLVGLVGCLMVGLVVFLEQRRQQIPLWLDQVRLRLEAWD
jgi:hypothetical protein